MAGKSTKDATQRTLTTGPGDKLKIIATKKPKSDITSPIIDDRTMATHKLGA